jgi:hypothetical protein
MYRIDYTINKIRNHDGSRYENDYWYMCGINNHTGQILATLSRKELDAFMAERVVTEISSDAVVEEYVRDTASGANTQFQNSPPNDGVTKSRRVYAQGKAVIFEHVLAIRSDVTEAELAVWRDATRGEVVPAACSVLRKDKFFEKGLHFRYRYLEGSGQVLDDFVVNHPACVTL